MQRVQPDILETDVESPFPGLTVHAYLLTRDEGSVLFLFTGDTRYRGEKGNWNAGFIPGHNDEKDQEQLAESLRLLRELEPDVVFGSVFLGDAGFQEMSLDDWPSQGDAALERLLG